MKAQCSSEEWAGRGVNEVDEKKDAEEEDDAPELEEWDEEGEYDIPMFLLDYGDPVEVATVPPPPASHSGMRTRTRKAIKLSSSFAALQECEKCDDHLAEGLNLI